MRFTYPARLTRGRKDDGYVVKFRGAPETNIQGETIADTMSEVEGA